MCGAAGAGRVDGGQRPRGGEEGGRRLLQPVRGPLRRGGHEAPAAPCPRRCRLPAAARPQAVGPSAAAAAAAAVRVSTSHSASLLMTSRSSRDQLVSVA